MNHNQMEHNNLRTVRAPIDITSESFRRLGHQLVDHLADFMDVMPKGPVTYGESPEEIQKELSAEDPLPEMGSEPEKLMEKAFQLLSKHSLFNGHPRFWGYITSSPAPIGVLGDFLAAGINPNVGAWILSPMASEIERQTVRWISELVNYPSKHGLMVSGGNMANFIGFLAAMRVKAGPVLRTNGTHTLPKPLVSYCSAGTHTWVQKAADLFGLGTDSIRWVKTDRDQRLDIRDLIQRIEEDLKSNFEPFLVIGNAGSVSTGAIDPMTELAQICQKFNLWFHIDGAYGGFAAGVPMCRQAFAGFELADSVAVDPHKWLYSPLEGGCILVKNLQHLQDTFAYHPEYYNFDLEKMNFVDYGMQNSRGFKALKVWLSLAQLGRQGFLKTIEEDINLAKLAFDLMHQDAYFESTTSSLSITTFRFVPPDLREKAEDAVVHNYLNELNKSILNELEQEGQIFISNARLNDKFLLRMCIVNFRTRVEDIHFLIETVRKAGRAMDRDLRPIALKA